MITTEMIPVRYKRQEEKIEPSKGGSLIRDGRERVIHKEEGDGIKNTKVV